MAVPVSMIVVMSMTGTMTVAMFVMMSSFVLVGVFVHFPPYSTSRLDAAQLSCIPLLFEVGHQAAPN